MNDKLKLNNEESNDFGLFPIRTDVYKALKETAPYFELILKLARQYYEVNGLDDYVEDLADDLDCSFEQVEQECTRAIEMFENFVDTLME